MPGSLPSQPLASVLEVAFEDDPASALDLLQQLHGGRQMLGGNFSAANWGRQELGAGHPGDLRGKTRGAALAAGGRGGGPIHVGHGPGEGVEQVLSELGIVVEHAGFPVQKGVETGFFRSAGEQQRPVNGHHGTRFRGVRHSICLFRLFRLFRLFARAPGFFNGLSPPGVAQLRLPGGGTSRRSGPCTWCSRTTASASSSASAPRPRA